MKFVIIGSGAIGCYFGAKLQQAGQDVIFVARGQSLRHLREGGLTLLHDEEIIHLRPVSATDDLSAVGEADYVLLCVKTWQLEAVVTQLPALKHPQTRFLTLQNGVEAAHAVARQVGEAHTLGGLVRGFFQLEAPAVVRHVGVQPAIIFGQLERQRTAEAERLLAILTDAGVYSELSDDIDAALWEKFVLVTALSGVGAVTRSSVGDIRDYEPTRCMLWQVMGEIVTVARARGVRLTDDVIDRTMQFVTTFPPEATSSMQRDILSGLPSELEAQTGAVVRLGREASVATPLNQFIYNSLILQERRARAGLAAGS